MQYMLGNAGEKDSAKRKIMMVLSFLESADLSKENEPLLLFPFSGFVDQQSLVQAQLFFHCPAFLC